MTDTLSVAELHHAHGTQPVLHGGRGILPTSSRCSMPSDCYPFHFHAMPNQFIEVLAPSGITINERNPLVITGTLQLTGQDESDIFYRLVGARKG